MSQNNNQVLKDYEREPVPDHLRKSGWQLGLVWVGVAMTIAAFVLGGALGAGLTLGQAFIAIFAGSIVLTIIAALCGVVGAQTGLSTAMITRFAFGETGSYLVALILALGSFGWFGVQTGLFGVTAQVVIQQISGASIPVSVLMLLGGALMTTTAVFGYKAIEKLSFLVVPLLGILMLASLGRVLAGQSLGGLFAAPPPGDPMPLGVATSIVAGAFMVGAVIAPDVSRYAKRPADAVTAAVLGFLIGFAVIVFIGSVLAHATGEADLVQIMLTIGWGMLAFVVLILAQWSTNDNNLYSAALAFSVIFRRWPKWQLTTAAGVLGTLLAMVGIYGQFVPFLLVLSAMVPAIGGVYTADYFLVSRGLYRFENLIAVPAFRPSAWIAWIGAVLVAFMTTAPPTGWGLFTLTTVSAIDSFLVAVVLQLVVGKALAPRSAAAAAPSQGQ